jgi:hypothetical protein
MTSEGPLKSKEKRFLWIRRQIQATDLRAPINCFVCRDLACDRIKAACTSPSYCVQADILQGNGLGARAALSAINIGRLGPKD